LASRKSDYFKCSTIDTDGASQSLKTLLSFDYTFLFDIPYKPLNNNYSRCFLPNAKTPEADGTS